MNTQVLATLLAIREAELKASIECNFALEKVIVILTEENKCLVSENARLRGYINRERKRRTQIGFKQEVKR